MLTFLLFGCDGGKGNRSVLVFSKTAGFRHASIENGKDMFLKLGKDNGFRVDTTEDATVFTEENLKNYNLLVFLSTTGDILNDGQQKELERFMKAGGNWLGIHAAADTEYDWPWYNELCGAYFLSHPKHQNATIKVLAPDHQSVNHLGETWTRFDEWYNYKNIEEGITPVLAVDESTYEGGENGDFHPTAWYRDFERGRSFYTGVGHTEESYTDPKFIQHITGAMEYLWGNNAPVNYADVAKAPEENRFQTEALVTGMTEPMELEVLPDGRPLWIERGGEIKLYDYDYEMVLDVATIDVWTKFEDGLLGLALDPNFSENNWTYLYYSPPGDESINRLSRFKFKKDEIDLATEQVILEVPTDRNRCCHSGGSVEFGGTGLLHLSIGDNTNPFKSDGFSPIDDSRDIPNFDARRSSGNTQDLRGGIVRIRVEEDGSYTIPEGNLFTDPAAGRPEIYGMGMRNPFRIHVDQHNGNVYWGDVGPDAHRDSLGVGPRGHDEVNVAREAGFFGWPMFIGDNKPYHERDFATGTTGKPFDPANPLNKSKYNTGAEALPPAQPAMIYYPYAVGEEFPSLGSGGRNAMAGPVFYRADYADSEHRFPEYYDGKFFFYDWIRDYVMVANLDETGYVTDFEPFMPNTELLHPIDMLFGPEGDLYVIEYGKKWFKRSADARLLRVRYNAGNRAPVPQLEIASVIGAAPFRIVADGSKSADNDGDEITIKWLLGDRVIGDGPLLDYTATTQGRQVLRLVVTDSQGKETSMETELLIGNSLPEVNVAVAGNQTFFYGNGRLEYSVTASDAEDQHIDPRNITVTFDYLEGEDIVQVEAGHQIAGQSTAFAAGKSLMSESDCAGCHLLNEASSGPAFLTVAERYRPDPKAPAYLAGKIISGGGGVWGERAMAAHPDIPVKDAEKMANYILSLAGPPPGQYSLPAKGTVALNKHRPNIPGRYILQASYTDEGGGDGLPRLTTKEVVVLRNPLVRADLFSSSERATALHVDAKNNPLGERDADVLVATSGGWSGYGDIDLTGVRQIRTQLALSPGMTSGGTISVLSGHPTTGKIIGTADIKQSETNLGVNELIIDLADVDQSVQPVYFQYRADSPEPDAVVAAILSYEFLAGTASK
ncbi:cytochrome c [Lewinella antarctica]|uniref:Cytochrome c n=2 Tax=Neolewinella antarctica TaxID=442734 RepID=A0ABX0X840_9BACT|nr:cytochrome c [Neolewinella antarctica]